MTSDTVAPVASAAPQVEEARSAFPHLSGGFVGFTAVAYFVSWQQTYTYYNELGVPWFIKGFSTTRMLVETGALLSGLLVLAVAAVAIVGRRRIKGTTIAMIAVGLGTAGLLLTAIGFFESQLIGAVRVFQISQVAIFFFGMSTALLLAGIMAGAFEGGARRATLHLWLQVVVVALGLWRAPILAGRARAWRDANPTLTALSPTATSNPADSGWRVVAILDRRLLLMRPAVRRDQRTFRLVESLDGWTIGATR
jgi:hypothetical protein